MDCRAGRSGFYPRNNQRGQAQFASWIASIASAIIVGCGGLSTGSRMSISGHSQYGPEEFCCRSLCQLGVQFRRDTHVGLVRNNLERLDAIFLAHRQEDVQRSFATACRQAGIADFKIHDLRHTCATWLIQAGVSIREVAEVLRHADIRMTMRYAHLAPENVRAAVDKISTMLRFGHAGEKASR